MCSLGNMCFHKSFDILYIRSSSSPRTSVMDFLSTPLPPIAISLAVILVIVMIRSHAKKKRYHPVAGTVFHHIIHFRRLHHYTTELGCKHKTYKLLGLFRNDEVYTTDPANIEYILKTNFANYGKGLYHHSILSDIGGDGIFTVDGERWRHQRIESKYELSTKIMRDLSSKVFVAKALKLARIISEAATCNQAIEIQDLFAKTTLDSVVMILLGIELDTMHGTNEESNRFSHAFDEANEITLYRYGNFLWKIRRYLNIGLEAVIRNDIKVMDQFVYKLIKSKIEAVHNSEDEQPKQDIVSRLLELREADPKYLRDLILCLIVAGKDTTAGTLSWFVYMLCKHPHIQEKIAEEVREATNLKSYSSIDELAASLTNEVLDKMQYLLAALTETLRLYPAVPVDAKVCFSDDTWPDGFSVKKGDMVAFLPYAMGRMKVLWGDDAQEFRPERWLDENGNFQQESPFKFTAFGAGPRICLGKEFAYRQMKIISTVLLGSFIFKLTDKKKEVKYRTKLTLSINRGLYVHASPRPCTTYLN